MIEFIDRVLKRISLLLVAIAALALAGVVVIVMAEVIMRAMGTPLIGGIELTRVTFVVSVFFAFAHLVVTDREIRVDVIKFLVPLWALKAMGIFAALVSTLFFGFLFVFALYRVHDAWIHGVYLEGRLLLPMWIPWATIVLGSGLAAICSIFQIVTQTVRPPQPVDDMDIVERVSKTN